VDPDALENSARPPFPDAPLACDVFAYSEHAVGRAGCTGARLDGEVKDHSVPGYHRFSIFEIRNSIVSAQGQVVLPG
jgi:hypothetical protein